MQSSWLLLMAIVVSASVVLCGADVAVQVIELQPLFSLFFISSYIQPL